MVTMVRKQVYVDPSHEKFLKRRARELGVTEAELIREGLDLLARTPPAAPFDAQAWADEDAFLDERALLVAVGSPWRFNREEIYEERLGKLSR